MPRGRKRSARPRTARTSFWAKQSGSNVPPRSCRSYKSTGRSATSACISSTHHASLGCLVENLRVSLVHEIHRQADIGVRYGLTQSDVTLMVKTICRDYGWNTGTSERNAKSGKRPKSKSPSPAARPTSSANGAANDPAPSRRTTTATAPKPRTTTAAGAAPKPRTIATTTIADEDAPSATRHSTPDDLGDDLGDDLDDDLDDGGYEARPRISRLYPGAQRLIQGLSMPFSQATSLRIQALQNEC